MFFFIEVWVTLSESKGCKETIDWSDQPNTFTQHTNQIHPHIIPTKYIYTTYQPNTFTHHKSLASIQHNCGKTCANMNYELKCPPFITTSSGLTIKQTFINTISLLNPQYVLGMMVDAWTKSIYSLKLNYAWRLMVLRCYVVWLSPAHTSSRYLLGSSQGGFASSRTGVFDVSFRSDEEERCIIDRPRQIFLWRYMLCSIYCVEIRITSQPSVNVSRLLYSPFNKLSSTQCLFCHNRVRTKMEILPCSTYEQPHPYPEIIKILTRYNRITEEWLSLYSQKMFKTSEINPIWVLNNSKNIFHLSILHTTISHNRSYR